MFDLFIKDEMCFLIWPSWAQPSQGYPPPTQIAFTIFAMFYMFIKDETCFALKFLIFAQLGPTLSRIPPTYPDMRKFVHLQNAVVRCSISYIHLEVLCALLWLYSLSSTENVALLLDWCWRTSSAYGLWKRPPPRLRGKTENFLLALINFQP